MARSILVGVALCMVMIGCAGPARPEEALAPHAAPTSPPSSAPPTPSPASTTWEVIGTSVLKSPIVARTWPGNAHRLLIIGSIHGNEPHGRRALERIITSWPDRAFHPSRPTIRIIMDVNPDGTAANTRGNARGVDLNRNLPATNFAAESWRGASPLSEPESRALHAELASFQPDVVIVLHSVAQGGPFVNYDGPATDLAAAFADGAVRGDPRWFIKPDMGYPTPGSLGSFVGDDRGIPILTIEFAAGHDPDLARASLQQGLDSVINAMAGR